MAPAARSDDGDGGGDNNEQQQQSACPPSTPSTTTAAAAAAATDTATDAINNGNKRFFIFFFSPDKSRALLLSILVAAVGILAASAILVPGISASQNEQSDRFDRVSDDLLTQFELAFGDYLLAGLWLQQAIQHKQSHAGFREVYEYIVGSGLFIDAASWVRNVSHSERPILEQETRDFLLAAGADTAGGATGWFNNSQSPYFGFLGMDRKYEDGFNDILPPAGMGPSTEKDFYFPSHYIEPMTNPLVRATIDIDLYSLPPHRAAINKALSTWQPTVTERLYLNLTAGGGEGGYYFFLLFHPGLPIPSRTTKPVDSSRGDDGDEGAGPAVSDHHHPRGLSSFVIPIPEFLERQQLSLGRAEEVSLYIFDSTASDDGNNNNTCNNDNTPPSFLGAARYSFGREVTANLPEICLDRLIVAHGGNHMRRRAIPWASREWTFVVVSEDPSFVADNTFVIAGSFAVLVSSVCLAMLVYLNARRASKINEVRDAAEAEKTAMIVDNAKRTAKRERDLNDFIAHECRNPLAAGLSACSFLSSAMRDESMMATQEGKDTAEEDLGIIENCLNFMNDLLRNMLDLHRTNSNQLQIEMSPTDVQHDVLEPCKAMLYRRGSVFDVAISCPEGLVINTDRLRLKQIMLNLGRNSAKFTTKGLIRFGAFIDEVGGDDKQVSLYVEDSGPGIPREKRDERLFAKFQESLDALNQGTGIGLSLCKSLTELLGGEIYLDETYDSGVEGYPGARFVVSLKTPPISLEKAITEKLDSSSENDQEQDNGVVKSRNNSSPNYVRERRDDNAPNLPESLTVLFVDDDLVLRKLFARSIRRECPGWQVDEAASGERALQMIEVKHYDIIWLDQYMASANKQLLGSETCREIRSMGLSQPIICGLSANEMEQVFLSCGADSFSLKPFPCQGEPLMSELRRILNVRSTRREEEKEVC